MDLDGLDATDEVRYLDIDAALQPELAEVFTKRVVSVFNNDNYELMNYSTADRRDGCYYVYDLAEYDSHKSWIPDGLYRWARHYDAAKKT